MKFSNFFFRFKNSLFASYGPYVGYQGLILTARSPTFQPCQNFQNIPVTFWIMGVLFDRGGSAPFFRGYKNKVGVYLSDPPVWPNCPIFTNIFFLERYELNEDTGTFFFICGSIFGFFIIKNVKKRRFCPCILYIHWRPFWKIAINR